MESILEILSDIKVLRLLLFLPGVYLSFRIGRMRSGLWRELILSLILAGLAAAAYFIHPLILFAGGGVILMLYSMFYDDEPFGMVAPFLGPYVLASLPVISWLPLAWAMLLLPLAVAVILLHKQGMKWPVIVASVLFISLFALIPSLPLRLAAIYFATVLILYIHRISVVSMLYSTELFQKQLLASQYEEVKQIYMQMRGWRHDYHSHLQTQKAYLEGGEIKALGDYLNVLEQDLKAIDLLVNSANPMIDAIFNSKLSLAKSKDIRLDVSVSVLGLLPVKDTDLCIMFGNLLDNAIEACEEIPVKERFIRVYCDTFGQQLYLSIQNSAKEILSFEERNYISTKRGNHGLGMKRVALLVDHYQGFLNLQNEPGIFAAELTLPLPDTGKESIEPFTP